MSNIGIDEHSVTELSNEQFYLFAENSQMGVLISQGGYLRYYNNQFLEIFGYSREEVSNWEKNEFFELVHPDDLSHFLEKMKIETDRKTITVRYRGIRKDGKIIEIENYVCVINFNGKMALLSSFIPLEETYLPKKAKLIYKKLIIVENKPYITQLLKDNNIKFTLIDKTSYKEEF